MNRYHLAVNNKINRSTIRLAMLLILVTGMMANRDDIFAFEKPGSVQTAAETPTSSVSSAVEMNLIRIETPPLTVSQGQQGIIVNMIVEKTVQLPISDLAAELRFWESKDGIERKKDRTDDYTQSRIDSIAEIEGPSGTRQTFVFEVNVSAGASLQNIIIDGVVRGKVMGGTEVVANGAVQTDTWLVQKPADLEVKNVASSLSEVAIGQEKIPILVKIKNSGGRDAALAVIDEIRLKFWKNQTEDRSADFIFSEDAANPDSLAAEQELEFRSFVAVKGTADPGDYVVDALVLGHDANSNSLISIPEAQKKMAWQVKVSSGLKIVRVETQPITVSQGQEAITVNMVVTNSTTVPAALTGADLTFRDLQNDLSQQYSYERVDSVAALPGVIDVQKNLMFKVNVAEDASVGAISIDGRLRWQTSEGAFVSVAGALEKDAWTVEKMAALKIHKIESPFNEINPGQQDVPVSVGIENEAGIEGAPARIDEIQLKFSKRSGGDRSEDFVYVADVSNPDTIAGGEQIEFNFVVDVAETVEPADYDIDAGVMARDANSQNVIHTNGAESKLAWLIEEAAKMQILSIVPSTTTVFKGQSPDWQVQMILQNIGNPDIDLDFTPDKTNIEFVINEPVTDEYEIIQPSALLSGGTRLKGGSIDSLNFIIAQTGITTGTATIIGKVQGNSAVNQKVVTAESSDEQNKGTVEVVENNGVFVNTTESQTLHSSGDFGFVDINQPFSIDVMITNSALSPVQNVEVQLTSDGPTDFMNTQVIPEIDANSSEISSFDVIASATPTTVPEKFTAQILGATITQLELPAPIDQSRDSTAQIIIQTPAALEVEFTRIEPFQTVGSTFTVQAKVKNSGQAEVDDTGELRLVIPKEKGYNLLSPAVQSFVVDDLVAWQVQAPDTPTVAETVADTFLVEISRKPVAANTGNEAGVGKATDVEVTRTVEEGVGEGVVRIDSVRIIEPSGAKDGILSTDQALTVTAYLFSENASGLSAQIFLPPSYDFANGSDFTVEIADQAGDFATATWNLTAPRSEEAPHFIYVKAFGVSGTLPITAQPDTVRSQSGGTSLPIMVVPKANLVFDAEISAPPSARDSILTINQNFTVTAELQNTGQAHVFGETALGLILPNGFTTEDPILQQFQAENQSQVSWVISAPPNPSSISVMTISVEQTPRDENTGNEAPVFPARMIIPVSVQETICLKTTLLSERKPATVIRGAKKISMFGLQFQNTGDVDVLIESIRLLVKDKSGNVITPNALLEKISVADYFDAGRLFAEVNSIPGQNPLIVHFDPAIVVPPAQPVTIDFQVDILKNTEATSLQLAIEAPEVDIVAMDADLNDAAVKDQLCLEITSPLSAGFSNIVDADLEANFFNFPNPFGYSDRTETRFNYYLERASEVSIRIYTLLGELVWSRSYGTTDAQGGAGIHDGFQNTTVTWDGTNGRGQPVLNGIYVAVLKTNAGEAQTKIAVTR